MSMGFFAAGAMGLGGGGGDPHWANVMALLHMDGADGSTTFIDSSAAGRAVTPAGNAQIDTAQFLYGGASGLFDGSGDSLRMASSSDFQLFTGGGGCTVEFAWRKPSNAGNQCIIEFGSANNRRLNVSIAAGNIIVWASGETGSGSFISATAPSVDVWHRGCLERSGSVCTLYVDGVAVGSGSPVGGYPAAANLFCDIGRTILGNGSDFNGWIDEVRVTKGVVRYGGNYTPSGPFPNG